MPHPKRKDLSCLQFFGYKRWTDIFMGIWFCYPSKFIFINSFIPYGALGM